MQSGVITLMRYNDILRTEKEKEDLSCVFDLYLLA